MCGISGTVRQDPDGPTLVQNLLCLQHRRGPDHRQWLDRRFTAHNLTFGHNRLSILDLDARSNQPFVDPRTNQLLVFNGEIYNYRELRSELVSLGAEFQTSGDTEVLLKAYQQWDLQAFNRFNGTFAFALYDPAHERILLVRDRFGVKPLYYHWKDGQLTFASNAAALAKTVGAKIHLDYLALGIRHETYEGRTGDTAFADVGAVPPGQCLIFSKGQLEHHVYYNLSERLNDLAARLEEQSLEHNIVELRELMLSATELRLRADVPTTLSLSGGLDSGLCAWLMREVTDKPFPAYTFARPDWDGAEAHLAKMTADRFGLELNFVTPTDLPALFGATLEAQGAPFADTSVMAQQAIFAEIHGAGFKVSLGGQGADEGFCGYRKFLLAALAQLGREKKWSQLATAAHGTALTLWQERRSPQNYFARFLKSRRRSEPAFFALQTPPNGPSARDLRGRQILDVQQLSLPTLLRYEDANSMHQSVESRMPFLDYRVMEFGLALPLSQKIHHGHGKYILRLLAQGHLPDRIVWDRNKRAFSLAPAQWLETGLGRHLYERVIQAKDRLMPLLTADAQKQIVEPSFFMRPKNFTKVTTLIYLIEHWTQMP